MATEAFSQEESPNAGTSTSTMGSSRSLIPISQFSQPFVPKPFPPPALQNVPEAYIVSQLHRLAPNYWYRPETADCTIIVPCNNNGLNAPQLSHPDPLTTGPFSVRTHAPLRRDSEPAMNTRRIVLKLHQDYLSAQSMFMRALFSGSSLLDLSTPRAPQPRLFTSGNSRTPPQAPRSPGAHLVASAPSIHHPRVLPSSRPNHPVIFLPVPDPTSIPHLVHYFYFGTFDYMEECLHRGIVNWQGIVRNVEFLGMRLELKASLGRYYRQWLRPNIPQDLLPMEDSEEEDNKSNLSLGSTASEICDQV